VLDIMGSIKIDMRNNEGGDSGSGMEYGDKIDEGGRA